MTHVRKQHGDAATEAERGQLPVTAGDLARIPEIVTGYDAIRTDLQGDGGAPKVAFSKRVSDGVLVYLAQVSNKRRQLVRRVDVEVPAETDGATVLDHVVNVKAPRDAGPGDALRPLSDYESDAQAPSLDDSIDGGGQDFNQGDQARGSFNPETFTVTLLKGADLSTALHEGAHFFFENDLALAAELAHESRMFGLDALSRVSVRSSPTCRRCSIGTVSQGDIDAQRGRAVPDAPGTPAKRCDCHPENCPECAGVSLQQVSGKSIRRCRPIRQKISNGRGGGDSNSRPLAPHASALPGCATPRLGADYIRGGPKRATARLSVPAFFRLV